MYTVVMQLKQRVTLSVIATIIAPQSVQQIVIKTQGNLGYNSNINIKEK